MKLLSYVSCICLSVVVVAQPVLPQRPGKLWDPWLIRAESITDSLVKGAAQLSSDDRALVWARLGVAWLKDDPDRARLWLEKAVTEIELAPEQESAVDRRRRLATARSLLAIIAPRDKQLGNRLLTELERRSDSGTDEDRRENANAVADNAIAVVDSDPQSAAQFGLKALRMGLGYRIATLLWQLRKRDSKLSDALFDQFLTVATVTYDQQALGWLATFAFRGQNTTDERQIRLLGVLADGLLRLSPAAGNEEKGCGLAPTAAPLLEQFNRFLPQQAPLIRQSLIACQSKLQSFESNRVDEALRPQVFNSVNDVVRAADDARDQKTRDNLLMRGAQMAAQEKAFERAIELLDRVSDVERKQSGGGWEDWRWSYSSEAAIAQLKAGNQSGMQRIISASPSVLRPFVQLAVVKELMRLGRRASAIDLLQEARRGMPESSPLSRDDGYMALVRAYVELDPVDALAVLNEAVKAINRDQQINQQGNEDLDLYARVNALSSDLLLQLFRLPAQLFEIDDIGVREAVSAIKLPIKRAAIHLNLLSICLEKHRELATSDKTVRFKDKKDAVQ